MLSRRDILRCLPLSLLALGPVSASRVRQRGFAAGAAAWAPSDWAGIVDYGIGSGITTPDVDGIYEWPGELGDIILAQATGSQKPQLSAGGSPNGNDVAQFDGVDDELQTGVGTGQFTSSPLAQPFTLAIKFKSADATHNGMLMASTSGAVGDRVYLYHRGTGLHYRWWAGSTVQSGGTTDTNWNYLVAVYDHGGSPTVRLNGTEIISVTGGGDELTGLFLGEWFTGGLNFAGDVAAWVVGSAAATGDDLANLETWLGDQ